MRNYIYKVKYKNEDLMVDPYDDLDEDEIEELKVIRTFAIGKGSTESAAWEDFEKNIKDRCRLSYTYEINKEKMEIFIEDCDIQHTMKIIFSEEVVNDPE